MAKKKSRRAKRRARESPRPDVTTLIRRHFNPDAPSANAIREVWKEVSEDRRFDDIGTELLRSVALISDTEKGPALRGVLSGQEAYDVLLSIHEELLAFGETIAEPLGSAEWLYWLRRLRGQFAGMNTMSSTEPYVQDLAEALTTRTPRDSTPIEGVGRTAYELPDETLAAIASLHHVAGSIYVLHSAMKRCAKGQSIRFTPGHLPTWVNDPALDSIIRAWDRRNTVDQVGVFASLGIRELSDVGELPTFPIGGHVPLWHRNRLPDRSRFSVGDPPPYSPSSVNLDELGPLFEGQILDKIQVSLVLLLWACHVAMIETPEAVRFRSTPAFQWGYFHLMSDETFVPALDWVIEELDEHAGVAISSAWRPQTSTEVLENLTSLSSEIYSPLSGCPIHRSGVHTIVDVFGASDRLLTTMSRPKEGRVGSWSARFEDDVQRVIDATAWRPDAVVGSLKSKKLKRRDGSALTDIDAVAMKGNRLILVSCKSAAVTREIARGAFAETRNAHDRAHEYLHDWATKVQAIRDDPGLLGIALPQGTKVDGCVVFPSVPYFIDPAGNRRVFGVARALLSLSELDRALHKA